VGIPILALILCICCPICMIYRHCKKRSHSGRIVTVNNHITTNRSRTQNQNRPSVPNANTSTFVHHTGQMIAIPNNSTHNNYPVQQSATLVPIVATVQAAQPQQPYNYSSPQPVQQQYGKFSKFLNNTIGESGWAG